ncbi:MAG: hypothetical protein HEP71_15825 [Roseivirga sp.]|nr:hypothetical protein [Roseivirga sp.]
MSKKENKNDVNQGPSFPSAICWEKQLEFNAKPLKLTIGKIQWIITPGIHFLNVQYEGENWYCPFKLCEDFHTQIEIPGNLGEDSGLMISLSKWDCAGIKPTAKLKVDGFTILTLQHLFNGRIDLGCLWK